MMMLPTHSGAVSLCLRRWGRRDGGFAGAAGASGSVEIGYEIAPAHRNKGYATAAARRLIERGTWRLWAGRVSHSALDMPPPVPSFEADPRD